MDDLKAFRVPVLILSGGEPLLRPDIFDISARAKAMRFYVGLSTNGALIDESNIERIKAADYDYVGISLDGIGAAHAAFRGKAGAFDASLGGLRLCQAAGIKPAFALPAPWSNYAELPAILDLAESEGVDKFYLSHLNYGGRGNKNRGDDAAWQVTRDVMTALFEKAWSYVERGIEKEFVTGNNDADGVYLYHWVKRRFPEAAAHIRAKLVQWGGNASGVNIANIDNLGNVHPDTFWWNYHLGNVRERLFSSIWPDRSDPVMAGLKQGGLCGRTLRPVRLHRHLRRQHARPGYANHRRSVGGRSGCYLTASEIGLDAEGERVQVKPFRGRAHEAKYNFLG